jgi:hypothetical protein
MDTGLLIFFGWARRIPTVRRKSLECLRDLPSLSLPLSRLQVTRRWSSRRKTPGPGHSTAGCSGRRGPSPVALPAASYHSALEDRGLGEEGANEEVGALGWGLSRILVIQRDSTE